MKKISKIKRLFVLCLFFLLSINSFAAIVSDNDGSAFITRAEFDSLKSNFQAQINVYNQNIDSKIDDAITSYLSGIKTTYKNTYNVFNKNWNYLTSMNYTTVNQYKSIDWDLNICSMAHVYNNAGDYSACNYAWYHVKSKDELKNQIQERILVDAGTESGTYPSKVTWDGISRNLHETIVLSESYEHNKNGEVDYYSNLVNGGTLYTVKVFNFIKYGYINDLYENAKVFWLPNFYYYWNTSTRGENTVTDWLTYVCSTSMSLRPVSGKTKMYEHIINYDNITFDYPTDVDWLKTINVDDDTSNTTISKKKTTLDSLVGCITKGGSLQKGYVSYGTTAGGYSEKSTGVDYVGGYGSSVNDNDHMPSLGLIKKYYDSKHIRQYDERNIPSIKIDSIEFKPSQADTLYNGYCVGAGCKNQKFKWKPKFINALAYSKSDGTLKYINFEVNVQLSYGSYASLATNSEITKVITNDGSDKLYETTVLGELTFDATLNNDGLIYCKWWPADTNIRDNYAWEVTMDLTNSSTYELSGEY